MSTDYRGPIFTGEADRLAERMCREMEETVSDTGVQMVRAELATVLRHPTGRYESEITTEPAGSGIDVTDGGIIYGPWLEGVGSRNRTTRFKGYATFRRIRQALAARADTSVAPIAERYVGGMG